MGQVHCDQNFTHFLKISFMYVVFKAVYKIIKFLHKKQQPKSRPIEKIKARVLIKVKIILI